VSLVADIARFRESLGASPRRRRWNDLSRRERATVLTLGSFELALTATAVADLYYRPPESVHGPKLLWWPVLFVQPIGPVAYLLFGRRR
jgi:hypothetical protein